MLRLIFNSLLLLLIIGIFALTAVSWYIMPSLPNIETLKDVKMQIPLRIYSSDNSLIAEFGEKKRTPIDIREINPLIIKAFISAEDDLFYEHSGVDWQGIIRATMLLITTGAKKQGGSTITMQVARNFFLSRKKTYTRKLKEILLAFKIESELTKDEILELYLNKIFFGQRAYGIAAAAYVYYGRDVNSLTLAQIATIAGLPAAPSSFNPISNPKNAEIRRNYVLRRMFELEFINQEEFDRTLKLPVKTSLHSALIDVEAPYVAEMVRKELINTYGNKVYSDNFIVTTTIKDKNQRAANLALRKTLLDYDRRHGYRGAENNIDIKTINAEHELITLLKKVPVLGNLYPGIVTKINEKSISVFMSGVGNIEVPWEGLKWARKYISRNFKGAKPKSASEIVQLGDVVRLIEEETGVWSLSQIPEVEGGLVSLNPEDGALLALIGGFDFYNNKFNRITQAKRQPGSGFKPFIYSAALAKGKTAATIINDAPIVFKESGVGNEWRPKNYSNKTYGPTRLREALVKSRNLVSVRLLHNIGIPYALEHIKKFGFDIEKLPKNLSLSLGSAEISPWEMARAYCVFANGGYLINPYYIKEVRTHNDEILIQADPLKACLDCPYEKDNVLPIAPQITTTENINLNNQEINISTNLNNDKETMEEQKHFAPRTVDPRNIWVMNSITRDVIRRGTGIRASQLNRHDLSGKTGTTNDQRDAWFSGFNSKVVTISWVGFDQFKPLGNRETGAKAALPMWIDYMRIVLQNEPESIMKQPKGLVNIRINPRTGMPTRPDNPNAIFETFNVENVPDHMHMRQPNILLQDADKNITPEQSVY